MDIENNDITRFLIVAPKYIPTIGAFYDFPVGLSYISASLKSKGYKVECLNPNEYTAPLEYLLDHIINNKKIDVLCTGGLSPHYMMIQELLRVAKRINPNITTIVGGGLVSCEPEMVLDMLQADIGVIGEGDHTIIELADALSNHKDFNSVNGIVYKDKLGQITLTSKRGPIKNIDTIPYPDFEGLELGKYLDMQAQNDSDHYNFYDDPRIVPIIASRSCPYQCTFCFHPLGKKYRQHSLDYLFGHIDLLVNKHDVNGLVVLDELFSTNANHDRLIEFCHRIKEYKLQWFLQLRVDSVNKKILNLCKDSGCTVISYGLESASDKILKSLKKGINVRQIENALRQTYEVGIGNKGNFIFGDKEETTETAQETINWWAKHLKYKVSFSVLRPYPGTELYHYAIKKGLITDIREYMKDNININLTKMSNQQYSNLINETQYLNKLYGQIPSYVVDCKKKKTDKIKGPIYSLEVICPHCGKRSLYPNMNHAAFHLYSGSYLLYCRNCYQKINVLPFNVEERIKEIILSIGNEKCAIWDNGNELLFKLGLRLMERMDYIISSNSEASKSYDNEKEIIHYTQNKDIKNKVTHVVYPIDMYKKEYYDQIFQMKGDGINVIALYAFWNINHAVNLINTLSLKGNHDEAKAALKQALDQFPISDKIENIEAEMEFEKGNIKRAIQIFDDLIVRFPYRWQAYNNLGTVIFQQGEIQSAFNLFKNALGLNPTNELVIENMEQCIQALQFVKEKKNNFVEQQNVVSREITI